MGNASGLAISADNSPPDVRPDFFTTKQIARRNAKVPEEEFPRRIDFARLSFPQRDSVLIPSDRTFAHRLSADTPDQQKLTAEQILRMVWGFQNEDPPKKAAAIRKLMLIFDAPFEWQKVMPTSRFDAYFATLGKMIYRATDERNQGLVGKKDHNGVFGSIGAYRDLMYAGTRMARIAVTESIDLTVPFTPARYENTQTAMRVFDQVAGWIHADRGSFEIPAHNPSVVADEAIANPDSYKSSAINPQVFDYETTKALEYMVSLIDDRRASPEYCSAGELELVDKVMADASRLQKTVSEFQSLQTIRRWIGSAVTATTTPVIKVSRMDDAVPATSPASPGEKVVPLPSRSGAIEARLKAAHAWRTSRGAEVA